METWIASIPIHPELVVHVFILFYFFHHYCLGIEVTEINLCRGVFGSRILMADRAPPLVQQTLILGARCGVQPSSSTPCAHVKKKQNGKPKATTAFDSAPIHPYPSAPLLHSLLLAIPQMGRHSCCYKQKLRKGLWSPAEDEKLLNHITKYGHGCWSAVPKLAGSNSTPPRMMRI